MDNIKIRNKSLFPIGNKWDGEIATGISSNGKHVRES